jgi:hypothetical protein
LQTGGGFQIKFEHFLTEITSMRVSPPPSPHEEGLMYSPPPLFTSALPLSGVARHPRLRSVLWLALTRSPKTSLVAHATTTGSPTDGFRRLKDRCPLRIWTGYTSKARERKGSLALRRVRRVAPKGRAAKDLRKLSRHSGQPAYAPLSPSGGRPSGLATSQDFGGTSGRGEPGFPASVRKGHNYLRCTKRVVPCTQRCLREEAMAVQVDTEIGRVALEAAIADNIIRDFETGREASAKAQEAAVERLKAEITTCEKQIELLLDMRLNEQISENEYVAKKCLLVNQKAEARGKLEEFERNRRNRFEPAIAFIKEAKQATILLAEGNAEQKRDFLRKIGSNFQMANKSLAVEFKNPWKLLVEFNFDLASQNTRQREFSEKQNWRRGGDSNPR